MVHFEIIVALVAITLSQVQGISLDVNSPDSIKSTAATIASNAVSSYNAKDPEELRLLSKWWEAGVLFDSLIQYWQLTGDDQYNDFVAQGLRTQTGPDNDFMFGDIATVYANEDQGIWALAAMSAAESQLPSDSGSSWVELVQTVFDEQVARWDDATCAGGLRWQIYSFSNGYKYKNSITNGQFFQLAARLSRYTGNSTYSGWASKVYDWTTSTGIIDDAFNVKDGTSTDRNCSSFNKEQFSNSAGAYISGLAHMYNATEGSAMWKGALKDVLTRTLEIFFPRDIATEVACEPQSTCNIDMQHFKGTLGHWLVDTVQMAPFTSLEISSKLSSTAKAAANACTRGSNGTSCPFSWGSEKSSASTTGLGSELSALAYVQGLLVHQATGPSKAVGSGTSKGDPTTSFTTPSPSQSENAGVAIGTGHAGVGVLAGVLSLTAWLGL